MARQRRKASGANAQRVVGYVRASTDEQHLTPDAQRAALESWCARQGAELVAVYVDAGVSGGAALEARPALLAAIDALETHGAGVLLVSKRDRLARDSMVAAMVERLAERVGARVQSADGVGEGDSPEAMLMRRMVDAFAEYERALIRARTRAALAVKRARGERVGSVPYGFRLAADGVQLEQDEREQDVLRLVAAYRADGVSLEGVAKRLEARGFKPRSGGHWHPQTLARIASRESAAA